MKTITVAAIAGLLPYDPGPRLRVRVDVDPVESSRGARDHGDRDE